MFKIEIILSILWFGFDPIPPEIVPPKTEYPTMLECRANIDKEVRGVVAQMLAKSEQAGSIFIIRGNIGARCVSTGKRPA